MSVLTAVNNINKQTLQFLPSVVATVQAVELLAPTGASGTDKLTVASQILAGIAAGSSTLAQTPGVPADAAAIAGLINLAVAVASLFGGIFAHKKAAVAPGPVAVAPAPAA